MEFNEIRDVLVGKKLENISAEFVDSQWTDPKKPFKPVLRKTVTYVVAAVLFNEEGHVLLTQEGFHPHRGHWYLPAGRVDPGETLLEATRREVREETGVECDLTTLIAVEAPSGSWLRFTFTGRVTGGALRTLDQKDWETLQGAYWPLETVMKGKNKTGDPKKEFVLRGKDILKLIDIGRRHQGPAAKPHMNILPCNEPQYSMQIRPVILCSLRSEAADRGDWAVYVLSMRKESRCDVKLPLLEYNPKLISAIQAASLFSQDSVKVPASCVRISGLLGVQHDGTASHVTLKRVLHAATGAGDLHDGLLLTVLVKVEAQTLPAVSDSTRWVQVADAELRQNLMDVWRQTNEWGAIPML